jgi:hypothetical protein
MLTEIVIKEMPNFRRAYKKLHTTQQLEVDKAVQTIIDNPDVGQKKKGDLAGVFVYKFAMQKQETLLAYTWDPKQRILLALGVHENFYRNLKGR